MSDIIKASDTALNQPKKFGKKKSLADKIEEAKRDFALKISQVNPETVPHRIALILDDSASTKGTTFDNEVKATELLLSQSSPLDTSYSLLKLCCGQEGESHLTCNYEQISRKLPIFGDGGTPLAEAMQRALGQNINRIVIISDGQPDSARFCVQQAEIAKAKSIQIDTIFVSHYDDTFAKDLLRSLATITGGIFMSFNDQGNFSKAIAYLAPASRGLLRDVKVRLQLGSGE